MSRPSQALGLVSGSEQVANMGQVDTLLNFFSSGSGRVGLVRGKVGFVVVERFRNASEALPVFFTAETRRGQDGEKWTFENLFCRHFETGSFGMCSSLRFRGSISTNEKSPRAGTSGGGLRSDTAVILGKTLADFACQCHPFLTSRLSRIPFSLSL